MIHPGIWNFGKEKCQKSRKSGNRRRFVQAVVMGTIGLFLLRTMVCASDLTFGGFDVEIGTGEYQNEGDFYESELLDEGTFAPEDFSESFEESVTEIRPEAPLDWNEMPQPQWGGLQRPIPESIPAPIPTSIPGPIPTPTPTLTPTPSVTLTPTPSVTLTPTPSLPPSPGPSPSPIPKLTSIPVSGEYPEEKINMKCLFSGSPLKAVVSIDSKAAIQILSFRIDGKETKWRWEADKISVESEKIKKDSKIELLVLVQGRRMIKYCVHNT